MMQSTLMNALALLLLLAGGAAAADAPSTEDALIAWLEEHGGQARGVTVGSFDGMGRGLVATKPLVEGDAVLTIPLALCVSRELALSSSDGGGGSSDEDRAAFGAIERDEDVISLFVRASSSVGSNAAQS
jgi:hypothetical protein